MTVTELTLYQSLIGMEHESDDKWVIRKITLYQSLIGMEHMKDKPILGKEKVSIPYRYGTPSFW